MADTLATFRGAVRCGRGTHTVTLSGMTAESPGEETMLTLSAAAPADWPEVLEDALVEQVEGTHCLIRSGMRRWPIEAEGIHLHRQIAEAFYQAIPPRPAPWRKRLFWRVVLALAASRTGLAALRMLRRRV